MDDLEQAAILLLGMGEENAAEVLKHLDHKQVAKIVEYMNQLGDVSEKNVISALNNFLTQSTQKTGLALKTKDYIRKTLMNAVGAEKTNSLMGGKSLIENKPQGLELLNWQPDIMVSNIVRNEHPQVIAIIFTYLDSEKAARVLSRLPKEIHVDIVKRLTKIGLISPFALDDLSHVVERLLQEDSNFREIPLGGIDTAANIVNFLDSDVENELIAGMASVDEALSAKIQERMFPFEKLATIDGRSMQTLLRNVANDILVVALKGADEELRETFYKNMSERAAQMIKDDLEVQGPISLSKVEAAQKEIVATAQKLAKEGQMVLQADDDVVL